MRFLTASALALIATTAQAYLDTSPFFMYSTSDKFKSIVANPDINFSKSVTRKISDVLASCPTENYIIFLQEGVTTSDYRPPSYLPFLASELDTGNHVEKGIKSSAVASEVAGNIDVDTWTEVIKKHCKLSPAITQITPEQPQGAYAEGPSKFNIVKFGAPCVSSADRRTRHINALDMLFHEIAAQTVGRTTDYTVLYVTHTPLSSESSFWNFTQPTEHGHKVEQLEEESEQYEMQTPLDDMPHSELKRAVNLRKRASGKGNDTLVDGPLFHRYQFFTPGIYMTLGTALLLLIIVYVGISALTSLQVTYAAFDKDNGPLASKKSQ